MFYANEYLIGGKLVGQKWRKNRLVTKFLTDENFWPTKLVSDEYIWPKNVFDRRIFLTDEYLKGFIEDFYTYDFTGIIHEEASDDESDFEMDTIEIDDNVDLAGAVGENNQKESEGSSGNEEKDVIILD